MKVGKNALFHSTMPDRCHLSPEQRPLGDPDFIALPGDMDDRHHPVALMMTNLAGLKRMPSECLVALVAGSLERLRLAHEVMTADPEAFHSRIPAAAVLA